MGKYDLNEDSLPQREHPEGAVRFKEPETSAKLGMIANGIGIVIALITIPLLFMRGGIYAFKFWGVVLMVLSLFPHEMIHAICFREDVYMYTNLRQGMLFVLGTEDLSKGRFIFMSLLPNILLGLIPFVLFMIWPYVVPSTYAWDMGVLGTFGALSLTAGAGDYINVYNALTQVPKGAKTYLSGFHSYWYMP